MLTAFICSSPTFCKIKPVTLSSELVWFTTAGIEFRPTESGINAAASSFHSIADMDRRTAGVRKDDSSDSSAAPTISLIASLAESTSYSRNVYF